MFEQMPSKIPAKVRDWAGPVLGAGGLAMGGLVTGGSLPPDGPLPSAPVTTVLALDVGGTKLAAAMVDDAGTVLARAARPTVGADGDELFGQVGAVLDEVLRGPVPAPDVVGVGCGGPMTIGGELVSPLNIPQWRDFPLRSSLAEWARLPVFVDNDAKALALGEGRWGAAAGVTDYLAMVVSTGVGGGIVLDGRLLDGAEGNAGHIGHVVVDPEGPPCACGGRGCLEALVSGSAIAAATGRPASEAGPELRVWAGRQVGRAVASVAALLDLRLAVVAGSVALGFGAPFFDAAQAEVDRSARISFARGTRVVPSGFAGHDGPLLGAAAVALAGLARRDREAGSGVA